MAKSMSLTHVALHVLDLAACVQFYENYCGLKSVHQRRSGNKEICWLAEPGREKEFILVIMNGGALKEAKPGDYSHLGFAVACRKSVDQIAAQAQQEGCLIWAPKKEPYPVGYYCGVRDPNGHQVEFSYGQPLGPGAEEPTEKGASKR